MGRLLVLAALVLGLWLVFAADRGAGPSGPARSVSLADLAADPPGWDGRQVSVTGRVIDRATVLGLGGVLVGDNAGHQLLAIGWTGPVTPGAAATVTGEYRLALAVGDAEMPLILIAPRPAEDGG